MSDVFDKVCADQGWDRSGDHAVLPTGGERSQSVHREVMEEDGEQILRIYSPIGSAEILDENRTRAALSINYRMRYGAMAIREDSLVLVDTFLVREADADEVRLSMQYIAETADRHEKLIYKTDDH